MHSPFRPTPGRRRLLTALTCSALVLAGCASETSDDTDTASGATTTAVTVPVTPVTTRIVDAGAEPRAKVTSAPTPGSPQTIDVVTSTKVLQQIDDQAQQDFSTPELTLPLTATATDDSEIEMVIGKASSADSRLTDALGPAEGSSAGLSKDESGAVTALRISPADDALDSARAAIEQAMNQIVYRSVSFPEDAIGIGAVWTVNQQVVSGITLNQVTTVTLRSIDDSVLTLDVAIAQTPESSVWDLPDNSGSLDIAAYQLTGSGTLTVDTTAPLPVGGQITTAGDQVYRDPDSTTVLRQSTSDSIRWGDA